jgi:hypothetical protein
MGIICGARKTFLELISRIRNNTEAVDLQQEIPQHGPKPRAPSQAETTQPHLTI